MKTRLFAFFVALAASISFSIAAITVRLDPQSCASWSTVNLHYWGDDGFSNWPGVNVNIDDDDWYSYTFDESVTSVSIIWNNGSDQTIDINDVTESTCYALNNTTGRNIGVSIIDCTNRQPLFESITHIQIGDLYYNLDPAKHVAEVTYEGLDSDNNYSQQTTITIPDSVTYDSENYIVTKIGVNAFAHANCTSITIPKSIETISLYAFQYTKFRRFTNYATTPQAIDHSTFAGSGLFISTCKLYVPKESIDLYKAADTWSEFGQIVAISDIKEQDINVNYIKPSGEVVDKETLTFSIPEAPQIEGFTFLKWVVVANDLSEGVNIQAVYEANEPTSAPAEYINPANKAQKLIREGNVYILTDTKTYTVHGQEVK